MISQVNTLVATGIARKDRHTGATALLIAPKAIENVEGGWVRLDPGDPLIEPVKCLPVDEVQLAEEVRKATKAALVIISFVKVVIPEAAQLRLTLGLHVPLEKFILLIFRTLRP